MTDWKQKIGQRLKEFREQANKGKGMTHERVATTLGMTKAYVIRLEKHLSEENPKLNVLENLASLYGRSMGDLFESIVAEKEFHWSQRELHEKLDFILTHGPQDTALGITENIHALYDRSRKLQKRQ